MKKFIFRRFFYLICIITFFYSINYLRLQAKVKTKISKNDTLVNKTEEKVTQVNYKYSLNLIFLKETTTSELTKLIKFMFQMNAFIIEIPVLEKEHKKMKINKINEVFDEIFFKLDENQPQKLTFGIFNETNDLNELIFWNLNQQV
jgi:hypothetical protein